MDLEPALARLPARQREAVVLRYFLDLSIDDTARVMRCTAGTVKSQVHKALSTLREQLQHPHPTHAGRPAMNTDDHLDTGLGSVLKEMAARWDTPVFDPVHIVDQSRVRTRRARRDRWGIGAICAGTCAIAAVLAVTTTTDPSARRPPPQTSGPGLPDRQAMPAVAPISKTCTPWTIEQARANSPFDVLLPHVPLANPSSVTHVWNCPADVTEQFASGISIEFEHNTIADPGASWRGLAASDPVEASVGSVQGEPAALIKPSATAVGSVTVVLGDTILWVIGNGRASLDDLVDVADSLTD